MHRYVVAKSLSNSYLAIRYSERETGEIEEGEVVAEFRDEKTARDFCQTWYGKTKKL